VHTQSLAGAKHFFSVAPDAQEASCSCSGPDQKMSSAFAWGKPTPPSSSGAAPARKVSHTSHSSVTPSASLSRHACSDFAHRSNRAKLISACPLYPRCTRLRSLPTPSRPFHAIVCRLTPSLPRPHSCRRTVVAVEGREGSGSTVAAVGVEVEVAVLRAGAHGRARLQDRRTSTVFPLRCTRQTKCRSRASSPNG
jgi:hypothetical protein